MQLAPQEPCSSLLACRTQELAAQLVLPARIFAALNPFKAQYTYPNLSSPNVCHLIHKGLSRRINKDRVPAGPSVPFRKAGVSKSKCMQQTTLPSSAPLCSAKHQTPAPALSLSLVQLRTYHLPPALCRTTAGM